MNAWEGASCQSPWQASCTNYSSFVGISGSGELSPIDAFYKSTSEYITISTPEFLSQNGKLGGLMLVGLISATENYFRAIFSRIIDCCPIAQASSSDAAVKLGSMLWHKDKPLGRGAFEHISFADGKAIKKACKNYLDIELKPNDRHSPLSLLEEFDRLCNLRHGVVHADSELPGNNALALGLTDPQSNLIRISQVDLQTLADICTSLVVSFNKYLFIKLLERWAEDWPSVISDFSSQKDPYFNRLWKIFHSERDKHAGTIESNLGMVACRNSIKRHYGVT